MNDNALGKSVVAELKKEFATRKKKNSFYSIRSFARDLKISKTTLSAIIAENRSPSKSTITKILDILPMIAPLDTTFDELQGLRRMSGKDFKRISSWYYLAIFHLSELDDNEASAQWISQKIKISEELSSKALRILIRHNYLKIINGKMIRTSRPLYVTSENSQDSVHEHHTQKLNLASEAIKFVTEEEKKFISMTIPVNIEDISILKEMINVFAQNIQTSLKLSDKNPTELFNLSIQLFPLRGSYDK